MIPGYMLQVKNKITVKLKSPSVKMDFLFILRALYMYELMLKEITIEMIKNTDIKGYCRNKIWLD